MSSAFAQVVRRLLDGDPPVPIELLGPWIPGKLPPRLAFGTIPLDGFALGIYARKRFVAAAGRAAEVPAIGFDLYEVDTNDPGMSEAWIDLAARAALIHAQIFERVGADGRFRAASFTVDANRFVVQPPLADEAHLGRVLQAGVALAQRPARLAVELGSALDGLGAELAADTWRLDDRCTAVFVRGAATVQLDWRRRLDGEPARRARLRTRVRAHGPDAPASIDDAWLAPRVAALAPLVRAANPASITAARGEVTLIWNGLVRTAKMVAPAIELLCRLVAPPTSSAPMR